MTDRPELTPSERTLRARMAAHFRWSKEDPAEHTAKMRAASPSSLTYWQRAIAVEFPDLTEAERDRRAESKRKAYMTGLALKSARARRARKGDQA